MGYITTKRIINVTSEKCKGGYTNTPVLEIDPKYIRSVLTTHFIFADILLI